jgi:hypothetical protein
LSLDLFPCMLPVGLYSASYREALGLRTNGNRRAEDASLP